MVTLHEGHVFSTLNSFRLTRFISCFDSCPGYQLRLFSLSWPREGRTVIPTAVPVRQDASSASITHLACVIRISNMHTNAGARDPQCQCARDASSKDNRRTADAEQEGPRCVGKHVTEEHSEDKTAVQSDLLVNEVIYSCRSRPSEIGRKPSGARTRGQQRHRHNTAPL